MLIFLTEEELELVLQALNIAGKQDPRFDDLYDELKERY